MKYNYKKAISVILSIIPNTNPKLEFTLEDGEIINVEIEDNSLFDAWSYHDNIGDINIWIEEGETEELKLTVYAVNFNSTTGYLETDTSKFYDVPLSGELEAGLKFSK